MEWNEAVQWIHTYQESRPTYHHRNSSSQILQSVPNTCFAELWVFFFKHFFLRVSERDLLGHGPSRWTWPSGMSPAMMQGVTRVSCWVRSIRFPTTWNWQHEVWHSVAKPYVSLKHCCFGPGFEGLLCSYICSYHTFLNWLIGNQGSQISTERRTQQRSILEARHHHPLSFLVRRMERSDLAAFRKPLRQEGAFVHQVRGEPKSVAWWCDTLIESTCQDATKELGVLWCILVLTEHNVYYMHNWLTLCVYCLPTLRPCTCLR